MAKDCWDVLGFSPVVAAKILWQSSLNKRFSLMALEARSLRSGVTG